MGRSEAEATFLPLGDALGDRRFSVLSRKGLFELSDVRGGVVGLGVFCAGAGAKVLPKCVPGPVSADGSGAFIGSIREAAALWEERYCQPCFNGRTLA